MVLMELSLLLASRVSTRHLSFDDRTCNARQMACRDKWALCVCVQYVQLGVCPPVFYLLLVSCVDVPFRVGVHSPGLILKRVVGIAGQTGQKTHVGRDDG